MKTHEQLATLTNTLERAGWVRLNGNTWGHGEWQLRTAYAHQEATLDLTLTTAKTKRMTPARYYRGAEPLTWAKTQAATVLARSFEKVLDKPAEQEEG